jgi:hypothetical protein
VGEIVKPRGFDRLLKSGDEKQLGWIFLILFK